MAYQVNLPVFEGPFDLLYHLIEKHEVDIYDIPIAQIAEEYLAYLRQMDELDLEVASSFVVMAAQLLSIKARMLLPAPTMEGDSGGEPEPVDPRAELVERLLEYRKFKAVAEVLKAQEGIAAQVYPRVVDPASLAHLFREVNPLEGVMMGDLLAALQKALRRQRRDEMVADVPREEVSVQQRMNEVLANLQQTPAEPAPLERFFTGNHYRDELIVTFLALLELVRLRRIRLLQRETLGAIYVLLRE
ncbi:segregation and condensation protein A [Heliophilum fasciatum]|uniref:Segregation and condensation protein A n=1 Tax=Heliophilum fasciatum TaxID=35700 RepID=A0A4R2RLL9_9FIRM|nr:segregation/condensation protein A [Heliophilum fasciatum]MCW2278339.1 segregation and condensation protein A [Heliophilum fasciatum]TCP63788.1 condensin subunit ScpA [Heliophilum fasciatum]